MKTRLIFLVMLIVCISCGTNNKPVSDAQKEKIKLEDEEYTVLDKSTVLYTTNCNSLMNFKDGHSTLADPEAMQFMFKKINNRWKVIYAVDSYVEKNVPSESSKGF